MKRPFLIVSGLVIFLATALAVLQFVNRKPQVLTTKINLVSLPPAPVKILNETEQTAHLGQLVATASAESFIVLDASSSSILIEKNARQTRYPASTAKLMTAWVSRQQFDLDEYLAVPKEFAIEGNRVGLVGGENLRVRDLLAATLIGSANDAAWVLAQHHPGGEQGFVGAMNQQSNKLGLIDTQFANSIGLDDESQLSTAFDLSLLARAVLKDVFLSSLIKTMQLTITDQSGYNKHYLYNTNQLLHQRDDVIGIKTGTTGLALEVLITAFEYQGHQIIIVVMGSQDRYLDTVNLFNWAINYYEWQQVDSLLTDFPL